MDPLRLNQLNDQLEVEDFAADRTMIVPDVNLLVYAYNDAAPLHDAAKRWWEGLVNGSERVGVP